jgi:hypothetical protein
MDKKEKTGKELLKEYKQKGAMRIKKIAGAALIFGALLGVGSMHKLDQTNYEIGRRTTQYRQAGLDHPEDLARANILVYGGRLNLDQLHQIENISRGADVNPIRMMATATMYKGTQEELDKLLEVKERWSPPNTQRRITILGDLLENPSLHNALRLSPIKPRDAFGNVALGVLYAGHLDANYGPTREQPSSLRRGRHR